MWYWRCLSSIGLKKRTKRSKQSGTRMPSSESRLCLRLSRRPRRQTSLKSWLRSCLKLTISHSMSAAQRHCPYMTIDQKNFRGLRQVCTTRPRAASNNQIRSVMVIKFLLLWKTKKVRYLSTTATISLMRLSLLLHRISRKVGELALGPIAEKGATARPSQEPWALDTKGARVLSHKRLKNLK